MALLYSSSWFYHGLMTVMYHVHVRERFRQVALWVPEGADLLDVCSGDGQLMTYLPGATRYRGLDYSEPFLRKARELGRDVQRFDLRTDPLPEAQVVVCQVSLFQFYPEVEGVLARLYAAARERLIISESVRSLTQSKNPLISRLVAWGTRANGMEHDRFRYNPHTLEALFRPYQRQIRHAAEVCGGRDWIYVLDK